MEKVEWQEVISMINHRETWIEIDLDAIEYNIKQAMRLNPKKMLIAVVKANGYGHGDVEVARAALSAGAKMLAVSSFDEALHLRYHGLECPILVMGVTHLRDIHLAIEHEITITVHDTGWIGELVQYELKKELRVHLKIDSGMHRLGVIAPEEVAQCFNQLKDHPMIKIEGIYTHMATADGDLDYLKQQTEKFQAQLENLDLSIVDYVHLANSATLFQFSPPFTQAIRYGIGMYGVKPGGDFISLDFQLKPSLALYSRLSQCKKINKGDKVGYGITYEAKTDEWIGVIPIGYADGWIRSNQGRHVLIDGQGCEIIGRVCMDQLMIRLPKEMPIDTQVTLIGEGMPIEVVAKELQTIEYEVFCLLSDRIPRIYKKNNKIVAMHNVRFERK